MAHPIDFVERFVTSEHEIRKAGFSSYLYYPQALFDANVTPMTSPGSLRTHYARRLQRLTSGEELAFNSRMWTGSRRHPKVEHMPLVDFVSNDQKRIEAASERLVSELKADSAVLCNSGRSYHLYIGTLISASAWIKFMARIVLLNLRGEPDLVDSRWVAHRIIGGQAALRWSANSNLHPKLPEVTREWKP